MAETYRIEIDVNVRDNTSPGIEQAQAKITKFEKSMEKTEARMRRLRSERWDIRLEAVDATGKVFASIRSRLTSLTARTWRISVGIASAPFRALESITNVLASWQALLAGVATAGATKLAIIEPLKMADDLTRANVAFETFLGNRERARRFFAELQQFAAQTPFEMDQLTELATKLLPTFNGNTKMVLRTIRAFGDAAALTGASLNSMELALLGFRQIATVGTLSLEELKQVTENLQVPMDPILEELGVAKSDLKDLGKLGIPAARAMEAILRALERPVPKGGFLGGMSRMMDTLSGQWSMLRDNIKMNFIQRWAKGLESVTIPFLKGINQLFEENSDTIKRWGDALEKAGRSFGQWVVDRARWFRRTLSEIFNDPRFQRGDFLDKLKVSWEKIVSEPFAEWYNSGGKEKIRRIAANIGADIGSGLTGFLTGALGIAQDPSGSAFASAGITAGKAFSSAFVENFDANAVVKKLLEAFKNIQPTWLGGKAEGAAQIPALALDAWLLGQLFGVVGGALTIGGAAFKGISGIRDWLRRRRDLNDEIRRGRGGGSGGSDNLPPIGSPESSRTRGRALLSGLGRWIKRVPGLNVIFGAMDALNNRSISSLVGSVGGLVGSSIGFSIGGVPGSLIGGMIGDAIGNKIASGIGKVVSKVDWRGLGASLASRFSSLGVLSGNVFAQGFNVVRGKLSALISWIGSRLSATISVIGSKISSLWSSASNLASFVSEKVSAKLNAASQKAASIWNWATEKISAGWSWVQSAVTKKHAYGGIFSSPHVGMVAERGPEAIIPLSSSFRHRGLDLWAMAGQRLGISPVPAYSGIPVHVPSGRSVTVTVHASPQINITSSANAADVLRIIRENIDDLSDEVADTIAYKLEMVFGNK